MTEDSSIFAEIDESLRIDNVEKFLRQHGKSIIAGCVGIVLATIASVCWKSHMQDVHTKETSVLLEAQSLMEDTKYDEALQKLEGLENASSGTASIAKLMRAEILLDKQQPEKAKKIYDEIAQGKTDPAIRSLSAIDSSIIADDNRLPNSANTLKVTYDNKEPFGYIAGELYALHLEKSGNNKEAQEIFSGISNDNTLPMAARLQARDFFNAIKDKK